MQIDLLRTQLKFNIYNFSNNIQPAVWTSIAAPVQYVPTQGSSQFNRTGNNIFCTSFTVNVQVFKTTQNSALPAVGRLIVGLFKQQSNAAEVNAALIAATCNAILDPGVIGNAVFTQPWPANITNVQILKDIQFSFGTNMSTFKHNSHH